MFVAIVLVLYSRRFVALIDATDDDVADGDGALLMAVFRRVKLWAVLHHSDQGSQDTSKNFQSLLASHGIICSMSRSGNCWHNVTMASVFSTLKTERRSKKDDRTRDDLCTGMFDYIENFTIRVGGIPPSAISAQYSLKI